MLDVRRLLLETKDRVAASDPGLGRLRQASSAAASVGTALPVQLGVAALLGYRGPVVFAATMVGAVVAMLASNALVAKSGWAVVRTAVFFPLAVAVGLVPAILTGGERAFQVVGFAAVLFGAVWVRRFGADWFFYGFMAWMGFFFATFLHAGWGLVPELVLATVVSTGWVVLLSSFVFPSDPRRVLHSTLGAFFSRGRAVARECVDLLDARTGSERARQRALRTLAARRAGVSETALLAEAWSAEPRALPEGWSAMALRRRLIETQQAVERFAGAAVALQDASDELVDEARRAVDHLARRRDLAAVVATERLDVLADRALAEERRGLVAGAAPGVRRARVPALRRRGRATARGGPRRGGVRGDVRAGLRRAARRPGGGARRGDARDPLEPVARLSMTSRQAVQVMVAGMLAIALGSLLSPTRYYWAVIAAFVTFTGTGTRSETFLKGFARIVGTLVGLVAASRSRTSPPGTRWRSSPRSWSRSSWRSTSSRSPTPRCRSS